MTLTGKGFYIWKILNCENGDPEAIANAAYQARLSHVILKIADRNNVYYTDRTTKLDLIPQIRTALLARNIQTWGWHYVYGDDPVGEAQVAIRRVKDLKLDGYVINAETEYKGKYTSAKTFMKYLLGSGGISDVPIALSSFRYPKLHPTVPWNEFLSGADYNMPQVYWLFATNPAAQLQKSVDQFNSLTYTPPIIPTGAAYREYGWNPSPSEVIEFLDKAKSLNLKAANFYEWANCRSNIPPVWDAIKKYDWSTGSTGQLDIAEQFITTMNTHDPNAMTAYYQPLAVHITAQRTVQGTNNISTWYHNLFTVRLPNAVFKITGFYGTGVVRHFTWTAISPKGTVSDGKDTMGLLGNKIIYHHTRFTIKAP